MKNSTINLIAAIVAIVVIGLLIVAPLWAWFVTFILVVTYLVVLGLCRVASFSDDLAEAQRAAWEPKGWQIHPVSTVEIVDEAYVMNDEGLLERWANVRSIVRTDDDEWTADDRLNFEKQQNDNEGGTA
jgi:hypothetical protein